MKKWQAAGCLAAAALGLAWLGLWNVEPNRERVEALGLVLFNLDGASIRWFNGNCTDMCGGSWKIQLDSGEARVYLSTGVNYGLDVAVSVEGRNYTNLANLYWRR